MNKKYLMGFIACAALTVTSCSNDEVMDAALQQEAKAIQFSTYLGRDVETKAPVYDINKVSLAQARYNYIHFKACKENLIEYVREPEVYEYTEVKVIDEK